MATKKAKADIGVVETAAQVTVLEKSEGGGAAAPPPKDSEYPGGVSKEYYEKYLGHKGVKQPDADRLFGQCMWGEDPDEMVVVVFFTGPDGDKTDIIVPHPDHPVGGKYFICKRNVNQPILKRALRHMDFGKHIAWEQDTDQRGNPVGDPKQVITALFPYKIVGPYEPEEDEK
jgi:hypothetical protein